ncbi:hypothetical protein [Crossiella sp. CA198]|uniref:hypothetical protein n=1 Tax=Crossiella sp. CA198 TaxID=3455607 RepID=UPI003F8D0F81
MQTSPPVPSWRRVVVALIVVYALCLTIAVLVSVRSLAWLPLLLVPTAALTVPLYFRTEDSFRLACVFASLAVLLPAAVFPPLLLILALSHGGPALMLLCAAAADRWWWSWLPLVLATGFVTWFLFHGVMW